MLSIPPYGDPLFWWYVAYNVVFVLGVLLFLGLVIAKTRRGKKKKAPKWEQVQSNLINYALAQINAHEYVSEGDRIYVAILPEMETGERCVFSLVDTNIYMVDQDTLLHIEQRNRYYPG